MSCHIMSSRGIEGWSSSLKIHPNSAVLGQALIISSSLSLSWRLRLIPSRRRPGRTNGIPEHGSRCAWVKEPTPNAPPRSFTAQLGPPLSKRNTYGAEKSSWIMSVLLLVYWVPTSHTIGTECAKHGQGEEWKGEEVVLEESRNWIKHCTYTIEHFRMHDLCIHKMFRFQHRIPHPCSSGIINTINDDSMKRRIQQSLHVRYIVFKYRSTLTTIDVYLKPMCRGRHR